MGCKMSRTFRVPNLLTVFVDKARIFTSTWSPNKFQDHRIKKFDNNIDLRKLDFLSPEKISECSHFINKDILQS